MRIFDERGELERLRRKLRHCSICGLPVSLNGHRCSVQRLRGDGFLPLVSHLDLQSIPRQPTGLLVSDEEETARILRRWL